MKLPTVAVCAAVLLACACGGGDDETTANPGVATTAAPATTTAPPPQGVEAFPVTPGHVPPDQPVTYPQTPPVGGLHHPTWQRCGFYDEPVRPELGVHSREHGAVWITFRPDLPPEERDVLRQLARTRQKVLVSRWDQGLPAPLVASSWGRQLKLESARDPRLLQFIAAYVDQAPEPFAPC